ncbi:MAG TPA: acetylxylan esterase [Pirellulaceae bacterium]|jgi:hypothetical protein|nr:acetylxylan esterase [Pirellulaceae bacterium]
MSRTSVSNLLALAFATSLGCLPLSRLAAQPAGYNYDESKVPKYSLPDPLVSESGEKIGSADEWNEIRRPELLNLFEEHVYGRAPSDAVEVKAETLEESDDALGGKAKRSQVRVTLSRDGRSVPVDLLLYLPKDAKGPVPLFWSLNFKGNHTTTADPAVLVPDATIHPKSADGAPSKVHVQAAKSERGSSADRWAYETIVDRGYGVATAFYGDLDPDYDDGFKNGVHSLFPEYGSDDPKSSWGTIAGWAWGMSRILDYLETRPDVDAKRVAVMGHSRLGKTALWAGASDPRFALVISNDSGCGGAALSRRAFGETVKRINTSFPHWFCDRFVEYNDNEAALPVDQHQLIALAAPRPIIVASATEDQWADPKGEYLSAYHAGPVFELLTGDGFGSDAKELPPADQPILSRVGYHLRSGGHDVTDADWAAYLDFADKWLRKSE